MALSRPTTPTTLLDDSQQTHNENTQPITIIRDFAYADPNASYPAPSEASTAKPFSDLGNSLVASSLATSISTQASAQSDNDSNALSYTTFYDPSWTLKSEDLKGKGRDAPALIRRPAEIGTIASGSAKVVVIEPSVSDHLLSRVSQNSHLSQTSQYSTQPIYPERRPSYPPQSSRSHPLGIRGVPLETLRSGVRFESGDLRPTRSDESSPDIRHEYSRDGDVGLEHDRHESRESAQTVSSAYSKYST